MLNSPTAWTERCLRCSGWKLKVCAADAAERIDSGGASATGYEKPRRDHEVYRLESDGWVRKEFHGVVWPVVWDVTPSKY